MLLTVLMLRSKIVTQRRAVSAAIYCAEQKCLQIVSSLAKRVCPIIQKVHAWYPVKEPVQPGTGMEIRDE